MLCSHKLIHSSFCLVPSGSKFGAFVAAVSRWQSSERCAATILRIFADFVQTGVGKRRRSGVKWKGGGQSSVAELVGVGDFEDSLVGRVAFGNGLEVYSGAGCRNGQRVVDLTAIRMQTYLVKVVMCREV
jgi:hypothetical protein